MKALGFLLSEMGWGVERGRGERHRRVTCSNFWFKKTPLALCWEWMQEGIQCQRTFLVKDIQRKVEKIALAFKLPIQYLKKIFQSSSEHHQFITYFSRAQKVPAIQSLDFINNNNENNNSQPFWEDPLGPRICDIVLTSIWSSWKAVIERYYSQFLKEGKMKVRKG